jgi:hypothetical protein
MGPPHLHVMVVTFCLFNDADFRWDSIALIDSVINNNLEKMWKERRVLIWGVVLYNLPGKSEKNNEEFPSE